MRRVWVLAENTFKEVIRDRVLYVILVFAVLVMGLSLALGQLSFAEQARISMDFGLSAVHLCTAALAIFIGSNLVHKEIEKKTIYTILVRPISRVQFILGKSLGLGLLILTMTLALALILWGLFWMMAVPVDFRFAVALVGMIAEALVLLGVTLVFAMFARPVLAVCFSVGVFLIGHWQGSLTYFAERAKGGVLPPVAWAIRHFLPDLERVNWKNLVLYEQPVELSSKAAALAYALSWFGICVALSAILFKKKDVG